MVDCSVMAIVIRSGKGVARMLRVVTAVRLRGVKRSWVSCHQSLTGPDIFHYHNAGLIGRSYRQATIFRAMPAVFR
jgi:hypothetical protein